MNSLSEAATWSPSDLAVPGRRRSWLRLAPVIIAAAALLMGWPTLWGDFLSGDDLMLILRMPLVSDPSWEHAFLLVYSKAHGDLYQPVPLLTFAWDFLVAGWFGIAPDPEGTGGGAFLFHLTNVLLHAGNALLVWWLICRLLRDEEEFFRNTAAALVALIFALHPMNVEAVAWLNGRMTLLACGFEFAALIAAHFLLDRWSYRLAVLTVLLTLCSMASKIRIELPVLLIMMPILHRVRPRRPWWGLWGVIAVITAAFTWWNFETTQAIAVSDWARAALHGSRVARGFLSLGWYVTHVVWPAGLSPWYPPAGSVSWTDGPTIVGIVLVFGITAAVCAALKWSRLPVFGWIWFLAAIGPTLYLTAVRRAQAADRYTYQSNIGLYLIAVWCLLHLVLAVARRWSRPGALATGGLAWGGITAALLLVSWRTAAYYHDNLARDTRIATLFPDEPGVWEHMSWVYFREANRAREESERAAKLGNDHEAARQYAWAVRNYETATELALRDAAKHPWRMTCESLQVVGMAQLRMGRRAEAIETLARALSANSHYDKGYARLGQAYEESGDPERAIWSYERATRLGPAYKPAAASLAALYRQTGRVAQAEQLYRELVAQNSYDAASTLALCEILMQSGRLSEARTGLEGLLAHIPNRAAWRKVHTLARTNLGACIALMGDKAGAVRQYQKVLTESPGAVTATVNLATLYADAGRFDEARVLLESQPLDVPEDAAGVINLCDAMTLYGAIHKARSVLAPLVARAPSDARLLARMAWVQALHGQFDDAAHLADQALALGGHHTLARMAQALAAFARHEPDTGVDVAALALRERPWDPADADQQLLAAAQHLSEINAENPWPYYLAAMVLVEQGKLDAARACVSFFRQHSADPEWHARAEQLLVR